jgi:hypothetical protein
MVSTNSFGGSGAFTAQVRNFRVRSRFEFNALIGNFINVQALRSTVAMDAISVNFDNIGPETVRVNAVLNANLLAHIRRPATQTKINARLSTIILPVVNGALNTMSMAEFVS